jgi:chemotaxis protein methyltransferase CheR
MQKERPGEVIRIWHAACASGEEPYSMAIALTEACCYWQGPIEIIGTDFNQEALDVARASRYRARALRLLPQEWKENYFLPEENERMRLISGIGKRVRFEYLNLMDQAAMEGMGELDIIFCRNAFIYFSTTAIRQVAEGFYRHLRQPGYLFLAAAESLLRITTLFELVEHYPIHLHEVIYDSDPAFAKKHITVNFNSHLLDDFMKGGNNEKRPC